MEPSGTFRPAEFQAPDLLPLVQGQELLSVYLATDPAVENAAQHTAVHWRDLREELSEQGADEACLTAVDPVVADAHHYGRMAAIFAGEGRLLRAEHLPRVVGPELGRWSCVPSLGPLLAYRQSTLRHLVVLADHTGSDILVRDGANAEHDSAGGASGPVAKSAPGGWSQRRYQQRAENTWKRNANLTAEEVAQLSHDHDAQLVVVGGDPRAVELLIDALPKDLRPRLRHLDGSVSTGSHGYDVTQRVDEVVATEAASYQTALLEELAERRGREDQGVDGAAAVFGALQQRAVAVLFVHDDPGDDRQAWLGTGPEQVALTAEELAGMGINEPRQARLPDVAIAAALLGGAGVCMIGSGYELPPAAEATPNETPVPVPVAQLRDGVGALLRWD